MQGSAYSCGLPLQQPGRPFYFVEVSEVPIAKASPLNALQPRAMYTRTSQVGSSCKAVLLAITRCTASDVCQFRPCQKA